MLQLSGQRLGENGPQPVLDHVAGEVVGGGDQHGVAHDRHRPGQPQERPVLRGQRVTEGGQGAGPDLGEVRRVGPRRERALVRDGRLGHRLVLPCSSVVPAPDEAPHQCRPQSCPQGVYDIRTVAGRWVHRVVRRARLQAPGPVVQAVVHIRREPRTGGLAQPPAPPWSAGWACRTLHRVRVRQNGRLALGGAGLTGPSVARTVDRPRFSAAVVVCPRRSGPLVSGSVRGRPVAADFPLGPCRSAATGAAIDPPEHPREQAHLPAEQPAPGQDARLPAPHADPRGSRDPGRSSAQGPGESVRLRSG